MEGFLAVVVVILTIVAAWLWQCSDNAFEEAFRWEVSCITARDSLEQTRADCDILRRRANTAEEHLSQANELLDKRQGVFNRIRDALEADEA